MDRSVAALSSVRLSDAATVLLGLRRTAKYPAMKWKIKALRSLRRGWDGSRASLMALLNQAIESRGEALDRVVRMLRTAAACAALALAVASAHSEHVYASECTVSGFVVRASATNPFAGIFSDRPRTLVDLDGDGDLDVVGGEYLGTFNYFENTGSVTAPEYTKNDGELNPLNGLNQGLSESSAPAFADLDDDGDDDLISGSFEGQLYYFENTGSASSPAFTRRTGVDNPFNGISLGVYCTPTLADIDGDGDFDAVVGAHDGTLAYLLNTGTPDSPAFVKQSGITNILGGIDVGAKSFPVFVDVDSDGTIDLLVGNSVGTLTYIANQGTPLAPSFDLVDINYNYQLVRNYEDGYQYPLIGDFDNDDDWDVIAGIPAVFFVDRTGDVAPVFVEGIAEYDPLVDPFVEYLMTPALADIDNDGDQDLFFGQADGKLLFYKNVGDISSAAFEKREGALNPLNGLEFGSTAFEITRPTFADLDGDHDFDLVVTRWNGLLYYFENVGTATDASFEARNGSLNPFNSVTDAKYSAMTLADLDGDGDFDGVLCGNSAGIRYFENTGDAMSPVFIEATGTSNPFSGVPAKGIVEALFLDIDADEDLDLFTMPIWRQPYFVNRGSKVEPIFVQEDGIASPRYSESVDDDDNSFFGAIADLNGDGLSDFVFGYFYSRASFYRRVTNCSPPTAVCKDATIVLLENGGAIIFGEELDAGSTSPELGVQGSYSTPSIVRCTDIGEVMATLTAYDEWGGFDTCTAKVTVVDLSPPVIADVNDLEIHCSEVYVDVPPAVSDACDKITTVRSTGTVDVMTPGSYVITYDAADAYGNVAIPVTRVVTVIDDCVRQQSADQDADFLISLSELLRVIQFYNSAGLHCEPETEDGFGPGAAGNLDCGAHDSDYNPQDWSISLTELLRVIQFYNSLGYRYCPEAGSEDGFCPGA